MKVTVKNKQSLMDVTVEKYGQIDNLVSVSNDNGLSISEALAISQELTVNSENKGDQEIKDKITTQGLSFNNDSTTSTITNISLWFLPAKDALELMYQNLHLFAVGGFSGDFYWASTENSATDAWTLRFSDGLFLGTRTKSNEDSVRACRKFTDIKNVYNLRDIGPGGGLVFYIDGATYYEAAKLDQSTDSVYSNIILEIGVSAQGETIGTGANNTLAIINQAGHTTSAAKICNDLN